MTVFSLRNMIFIIFIFILFYSNISYAFTDFESLRNTAEKYRDYAINKSREAVEAKKRWMQEPTIENQNKFNRLRDEAHEMFKKLDVMLEQIEEAERASAFWSQTKEIVSRSVEDIGGYISTVATKLFGASDEELFGPNWQQINQQYRALSEKHREIIERKKKLLQTPDKEKEIEELLKEIETIKKKYELLRIAIRTEQEALPFLSTFWGEDNMGRYINACVENFDIVSTVMSIITLNPKIIYDLVKPAILLKFGEKYIHPSGNLTHEIADAIVIDILNVGPSQAKTVVDGLVSKGVLDPLQEKLLKEYEKNAAKQFDSLKDNLIRSVRGLVEKEMENEILAHIKELPYEKFPATSPSEFSKVASEYFNKQAVRTKYIQMTQKSMEKEIGKLAQINKAGYASAKKEALGAKLSTALTVLDFVQELVTIYANSPLVDSSLQIADAQAKKIREIYREKVNKKEIDKFEVTENAFVNKVWKEGWKFFTANGNSEYKKTDEKNEESIEAKKPMADLIKKIEEKLSILEEIEPKETVATLEEINFYANLSYEIPDRETVSKYIKITENLYNLFNSKKITADDFILSFQNSFNSLDNAFRKIKKLNEEIYKAKIHFISRQIVPGSTDYEKKVAERNSIFSEYQKLAKNIEEQHAELINYYKEFIKRLKEQANQHLINFKALITTINEYQKSIHSCAGISEISELSQRGRYIQDYNQEIDKIKNKYKDGLNWQNLSKINLGSLREILKNLLENEQSIIKIADFCEPQTQSILEKVGDKAGEFIKDLDLFIERDGKWVELLYYMIRNYSGKIEFLKDGLEVVKDMTDRNEISLPEAAVKYTRKSFNEILNGINDNLKYISNEKFLAKRNVEKIKELIDALKTFETNIKDLSIKHIELTNLLESRRNTVDPKVVKILKGEQSGDFSLEENTIVYLITRFSDKDNNYIPPNMELASWMVDTNKKIDEIQKLVNKIINPDKLIPFLSNYEYLLSDIEARISMIDYDKILNSYEKIKEGIPDMYLWGLDLQIGFIMDTSQRFKYKGEPEYKKYAEKLLNLMQGISELQSAIRQLYTIRELYKNKVREWWLSIIKIASSELPKIDKLLDENKVELAKQTFENMKNSYPPYPTLPSGALPVAEKDLGLEDLLTKHQELMLKVSGRLEAMLKRGPEPDGNYLNLIRDLYNNFKSAYESRNDSLVMSFLGDSWSAGDGTTLADLQNNLRRTFKTFDEVRFNLQNLQIANIGSGIYRISYDVTITSRIYKRNIKHEEKSSVVEEITVDSSSKKAKINRTISGRFWYIK